MFLLFFFFTNLRLKFQPRENSGDFELLQGRCLFDYVYYTPYCHFSPHASLVYSTGTQKAG